MRSFNAKRPPAARSSGAAARGVLDVLGHRLPFEQLHRDGGAPAVRALEAVERDDVGVLELRADLCLEHEAPERTAIALELAAQALERDDAAKPAVLSDENVAHAPLTEQLLELEALRHERGGACAGRRCNRCRAADADLLTFERRA